MLSAPYGNEFRLPPLTLSVLSRCDCVVGKNATSVLLSPPLSHSLFSLLPFRGNSAIRDHFRRLSHAPFAAQCGPPLSLSHSHSVRRFGLPGVPPIQIAVLHAFPPSLLPSGRVAAVRSHSLHSCRKLFPASSHSFAPTPSAPSSLLCPICIRLSLSNLKERGTASWGDKNSQKLSPKKLITFICVLNPKY